MTSGEEALNIAKMYVSERTAIYGRPLESFDRVAYVWSAIFNKKFSASDVCIALAALKLVRLSFNPTHTDSAIDMAGYAACQVDCAEGLK